MWGWSFGIISKDAMISLYLYSSAVIEAAGDNERCFIPTISNKPYFQPSPVILTLNSLRTAWGFCLLNLTTVPLRLLTWQRWVSLQLTTIYKCHETTCDVNWRYINKDLIEFWSDFAALVWILASVLCSSLTGLAPGVCRLISYIVLAFPVDLIPFQMQK